MAHISAVSTPSGPVIGRRIDGVWQYRGIPYGAATDGQARFGAPHAVTPWTDPFDARRIGPRAVQKFGNLFQSEIGEYFAGDDVGDLDLNDQRDSENCLVLNVVTPSADGRKRPVLVYLHGGGFTVGSGVLGSVAFRLVAEEDVVLVSVNHRLGVLGFLDLSSISAELRDSGNAGMLDIVLALEWVQRHVESFGGDSGNVTVFGESGGGAKIETLLVMPRAEGLFHKAIVESSPWIEVRTAETAAEDTARLLAALDIGTGELDSLYSMSAESLCAAATALDLELTPVVDGVHVTRHPFVPDAPPRSRHVPMLIGTCADEMAFLELDALDAPSDEIARRLHRFLGVSAEAADTAYRNLYPAMSATERYLRIRGDGIFGVPAHRMQQRQAAHPGAVFAYLFQWRTPSYRGRLGAFHTAELPLVMRRVRYPESEDLSRRLASAWAAFARTGDPSTTTQPWPRYELVNPAVAVFDIDATVLAHEPLAAVWEAWNSLPQVGLVKNGTAQSEWHTEDV